MKNKTLYTLLIAISVIVCATSCGNKEEKKATPAGMIGLDLSRYGKPFVINVPDTSLATLHISEETSGALNIWVGEKFGVSINEQMADLEMKKQDIREDEVNKLKTFVKETPESLIWESEIVKPEHHFLLNRKIADAEYSFEDIRDTEKDPFTKEEIQKMFDACELAVPVKKDANS